MSSDKSETDHVIASPQAESTSSPLHPPYESPQPSSEPSSDICLETSSPLQLSPVSSPLLLSSDHNDCSSPELKRKRYTLSNPKVDKAIYWPPATKTVFSDDSASTERSNQSHVYKFEFDEEQLSSSRACQDAVCTSSAVDDDHQCASQHSGNGDSVFCASDCLPDGVNIEVNKDMVYLQDHCSVSSSGSSSSEGEESGCSSGLSSDSSDKSSSSSSSSSDSEDEDNSGDIGIGKIKLYEGCQLTVDEGVLLLVDLFMTQKLTKTTMECVLKVIIKLLPDENNMPKSRHDLFQYIEDISPPVTVKVHYYCKNCIFYIGEKEERCNVCGTSDCNKFYQLSIADQLKSLFKTQNLAKIIEKYSEERSRRQSDEKYFDICDGSEYKRVQLPGKFNLTLLGHTDGVSISKSSKMSLWPVEFVICEVPPHLRYKFVIIAAVWVDVIKPNMHCLLKPIVSELEVLFNEGVTWMNPLIKTEEKSFVVAPFFCGDAPVRASLQNILSIAGKYSCNICEQKTVKLPMEPIFPGVKKAKRKRVFVPREISSPLRTAERMETQGKACLEQQQKTGHIVPQKGVRGNAIISKIPQCDRSKAVYPEYMHSLLGIIKLFMHLWFETDLDCNLKKSRAKINAFLESIRVPDFVTRSPTSTDNYSQWKANECRSFLLYFSLIILQKFMSRKYLEHWMLFVSAVYLLLQDSVSEIDVQKADVLMKMFLRDFGVLYSVKSLTYNIHNLSHYAVTTTRIGPLWSNSAFPWEDFNGSLEKCIHGTKTQGIELVKTVQLYRGVQLLKARLENDKPRDQLDTTFRNKIVGFRLTDVLERLLAASNLRFKNLFYRAIVSGDVYTCSIYKRQKKKNNFTVCYEDDSRIKRYGEIYCFVESCDDRKLAFVKGFVIEHLRMFCHESSGVLVKHLIPVKESNEFQLIPVANILYKVIRVDSYVCIRPNKYEVNL